MNNNLIQTITAAEHLFYLVGSIDSDVRGWYGGCITTAIHLLDTRLVTTVDNDEGLDCVSGFLQVRIESRQVTAAIDTIQLI